VGCDRNGCREWELRSEKGEGRREKGEGRREKGEGRREDGEVFESCRAGITILPNREPGTPHHRQRYDRCRNGSPALPP
jgi:hypothetical protein